MIRRFLGAVQFLTIVPVRMSTVEPGRAVVFFPFIGAWLGVLGAALLDITLRGAPVGVAAIVVVMFWAVITGGLHEDAVADVFDAYRAGRSREKILEIMKDSRIGAYGALALVIAIGLRSQAVANVAFYPVAGFAAALGIGRASGVALAWIAPPAGSGLGMAMSQVMSTGAVVLAIAQALALAAWCGLVPGIMMIAGAALIVLFAYRYFLTRTGGVTGDCLGVTAYAVETYILVLLTCQSCIS